MLAVGSGQEIMPQDDSAIPVEFDMSLYSTSDVIVAGSYSDSSGRDGAADGNFLDPQLTVFARAVEGNLRFVGNINDGTLPYEWSRTVQAQTAAGTIMWTTPFTATKEVSWDDFAGEYPLECVTSTAPGGYDFFDVGTEYTWTVRTDGRISVLSNRGERYPAAGSIVKYGDLNDYFPSLPDGLIGIVYLHPSADFDPDNPNEQSYDEIFGIAEREDGSNVAGIYTELTTERYIFDDQE